MISRRLIRIKILQVLYAFYKSENSSVSNSEKELFFSLKKTYDLYNYLFQLILDIARYAESRIELAKQKKIPTQEDLHPNTRFIDNRLIEQLSKNYQLNKYLNENKLSWVNYPELIKKLFQQIQEHEIYQAYMNNDHSPDYAADKKLITFVLEAIFAPSEDLGGILEEQSIYWNDDVEFVISMMIKTIRRFKEHDNEYVSLMSMFKNEEDRNFAKQLFRKSIVNHKDYSTLIEKYTRNWDVDRIAYMDIIIMQQAISEVIEFPSIPTRVTFNEYIEISKYYSTPKSSVFINGILDKVVQELKEKNIINKQGRGLIGEI
ncbi:MAG TPA: transcription antitermination factor NusB [Bacteroidales bacterium]|nr:transcription antitermination factor NusB [Bacteroidales bacterium]